MQAKAREGGRRVVRNRATRKVGTRETQRAHQGKLKEILLTFSSDDSAQTYLGGKWTTQSQVKLVCIFRAESRPRQLFYLLPDLLCLASLPCWPGPRNTSEDRKKALSSSPPFRPRQSQIPSQTPTRILEESCLQCGIAVIALLGLGKNEHF